MTDHKCIVAKCNKRAQYIYLFKGTGGSYCLEHLNEQKAQALEYRGALIEEIDKIKAKWGIDK